jgi:signal transduction histidine kinase
MSFLTAALLQLLVLCAVIVLLEINPSFQFPEAFLLLSIVVVALIWGAGPGLLATVISTAFLAALVLLPTATLALRGSEDLAAALLLLAMGGIICLLVAQNEYQRRRAEHSAARMEEFLSLVTHELRTPLTSLKVMIQLAVRQSRQQHEETRLGSSSTHPAETIVARERAMTLLVRAERQIAQLTRLVGDLVDAARIQTAKLALHPAPCELNVLLREVIEDQRQALPERTLQLQLPPEPVRVLADADRIAQVVTNYLTNASKYSPPDRPVTLELQVRGQCAWVAVHDQGPGLSPEQQQRLWQRGERLREIPVQSDEGGNLGLGLFLSRAIVVGHGGQVGVESSPGQGATFWFTLPLAASPPH